MSNVEFRELIKRITDKNIKEESYNSWLSKIFDEIKMGLR